MSTRLSKTAQRVFLWRQIDVERHYAGLEEMGDNSLLAAITDIDWVCVLFHRVGCHPCSTILPFFKKVDQEILLRGIANQCKVVTVDANKNPALTARFDIYATPATLLFYKGQEITRAGFEIFNSSLGESLGFSLIDGSGKQKLMDWINIEGENYLRGSSKPIPTRSNISWLDLPKIVNNP